jgi:hypothetical protein
MNLIFLYIITNEKGSKKKKTCFLSHEIKPMPWVPIYFVWGLTMKN